MKAQKWFHWQVSPIVEDFGLEVLTAGLKAGALTVVLEVVDLTADLAVVASTADLTAEFTLDLAADLVKPSTKKAYS